MKTLRYGRYGDRIPVGGEIFRACPDLPWWSPSILYNGHRVIPGGKVGGAGRGVDHPPPPAPRLNTRVQL